MTAQPPWYRDFFSGVVVDYWMAARDRRRRTVAGAPHRQTTCPAGRSAREEGQPTEDLVQLREVCHLGAMTLEIAGIRLRLFNLLNDPRLNHQIEVVPGVLKTECAHLMVEFFESIRKKEK